jgi:hypothetical protein
MTIEDIEGHPIQGSSRSVYLVRNHTRHAFGSSDAFFRAGFEWDDVWHLSDDVVEHIPEGDILK